MSTTTPEIRYITLRPRAAMKVAHYWVRADKRNGRRQLLDIVTDGAFVRVAIVLAEYRASGWVLEGWEPSGPFSHGG